MPLELEARNLSSTSLMVQWNNVNNFVAYVIIIDDNVETPHVEHARDVSRNSYPLRNLRSGHNYKIGGKLLNIQIFTLSSTFLNKTLIQDNLLNLLTILKNK